MRALESLTVVPITPDPATRNLFHQVQPPPLTGISARYLENAEEDAAKFTHFGAFIPIQGEIDRLGVSLENALVLDVCSGFGNTVIPLLQSHPTATVVASDLSEHMLRILLRNTEQHGVGGRAMALVADAQQDIWREGFADFAVGGAAMHHMVDPERAISAVLKALKPGGAAVFSEPMEPGHVLLQLAYEAVLRLPEMQQETYGGAAWFLRAMNQDISARTHHRTTTGPSNDWDKLDDKWLFPISYMRDIADRCSCNLTVQSIQHPEAVFSQKTDNALRHYGGLKSPDCLPAAAWEILYDFDRAFSRGGLADVPIEAILVFQKR